MDEIMEEDAGCCKCSDVFYPCRYCFNISKEHKLHQAVKAEDDEFEKDFELSKKHERETN